MFHVPSLIKKHGKSQIVYAKMMMAIYNFWEIYMSKNQLPPASFLIG